MTFTGDFDPQPNQQLVAITDGFNSRIEAGIIPHVNAFAPAPVKELTAAEISTPEGLRIKVYTSRAYGPVESATVLIEDWGSDMELVSLIQEKHGGVPIRGIEVSLSGNGPSNNGRARVILPEGHVPVGTSTRTYTYVSPDVTQALLERIPTTPAVQR